MAKRLIDILGGVAAVVCCAPVIAIVALLVRRRHGTPVIFRQQRAGLGARSFELVKFRTMSNATSASGRLLPDEERLTPFGSWLRRSSLDELPELWHVLKGDMSLVGPRPLPVEYLDRYTPEQARRHEVKPGLTGWAQINGRNTTTWDERLAMDVWYVDNQSFWLDLKILWRTIAVVLRREGISAEGEATMSELPPLPRDDAG